MKRRLPRTLTLTMCVILILAILCGCAVSVDTDMRINGEFSGERVMTTDEKKDSDLAGTSREEFLAVLQKHAPESMKVECIASQTDSSQFHFVFTLQFNSLEDYAAKVSAITGKQQKVEFEYIGGTFNSGYKLKEDFTSGDLLKWCDAAVKSDINAQASFDVSYGETVVTMDGVSTKSEFFSMGKISVNTISSNQLMQEVVITTGIAGDNDFTREIELRIPTKTYDKIGEAKMNEFVTALLAENATGQWNMAADSGEKYNAYVISFSGDLQQISAATATVFPGSSLSCEKVETSPKPFSESCIITENFEFDGFPCNEDGSTNATIVYQSLGGNVIHSDGTTLTLGQSLAGEGLSEDALTLKCEGADNANVTISCDTVYQIEDVTVATQTNRNGTQATVDIIFDFEATSSASAVAVAMEYFTASLEGSGVTPSDDTVRSGEDEYHRLVLSTSGTPDEIGAALNKGIGGGSELYVKKRDRFELYETKTVVHKMDMTDLLAQAGYEGLVTYRFTCDNCAVANVKWTGADGTLKNDLLGGNRKNTTFTTQSQGNSFTMEYQYRHINIWFVLAVIGGVVGVVVLLILFAVALSRILKARRQKQKEALRKKAVEQSVALAVIEQPDGTIVPLSTDEMVNRPGAVVESVRDDGLDDDDDEPENVWLFSTTLKLIALIAAVLFFFPFVTVSCASGAGDSASFSALNLMLGVEHDGTKINGDWFMGILLVIPLVIILLLIAKNKLPRILTALTVGGLSLVNLLFLLNLEERLKEKLDAFIALSGEVNIHYSMSWAYQYLIMIYVLLLGGAVILAFAELSVKVRKRLK